MNKNLNLDVVLYVISSNGGYSSQQWTIYLNMLIIPQKTEQSRWLGLWSSQVSSISDCSWRQAGIVVVYEVVHLSIDTWQHWPGKQCTTDNPALLYII